MKLSFSTIITLMVFSFAISAAERKPEPIGDPIPSKIAKGEIRVALENFVRFLKRQNPQAQFKQTQRTPESSI